MAVQIFRYVTKDKILALEDMLSLESKKNKIAVTLLEYGEDFKAKTTLHHYLDPDAFKVICWEPSRSGSITKELQTGKEDPRRGYSPSRRILVTAIHTFCAFCEGGGKSWERGR